MIKVNSQSFSLPSTLKQSGDGFEIRETQQQLENRKTESPSRAKTPSRNNQLCYVTERILAAILPAKEDQRINDLFACENGSKNSDKYESDLLQMLEQKHGKNYRLFDLESCVPTISLEKLCELCKHIESWLNGGSNRIVVLQDRESFQRVGTSVAAYLHYQRICSSNLAPYSIKANGNDGRNFDLDEYSMQKFLDDIVGPILNPAYKRYLEYFIGLLSGEIKINSMPLYLRFIKMESPPCMHHKISYHENEWSSFIKIFEGDRFVFMSDIYVMPISTRQFIYEIKSPLVLRGDVFIHFFQVYNRSRETELISTIQFHTCAITRNEVEFHKNDILFPQSDEKFPPDHKVALTFSKTAEKSNYGYDDVLIFQNPLIRKEPISNYSSIADLSQYAQHTQGPVDGSLYATIAKSQNSPGTDNGNELTVQNIQTIETRLNTPTSKNSRILSTILEWDNIRNGENGTADHNGNSEPAYMQVLTSRLKQEPKSIKSPLQRSYDSGIYSHEVTNSTNKNNTSSAFSWQERTSQSPTANNCHVELDNLLSEMLLTVETLPDLNVGNAAAAKSKQTEVFPIKQTANENITTTNPRSHIQTARNYNYDSFGGYSKNNQDDVSSTTQTLTPSESRCPTPSDRSNYHHDDPFGYDTDTMMNLHGGARRHTENLLQASNQSYMEFLQTRFDREQLADQSIPYHAREHSKPFSYLPSTTGADGKMLKMQSGLSSPSMVRKVRKALNHNGNSVIQTTTTTVRKIPSDFEERTRFGRSYESKYTFGDKTPENNLNVFGEGDKLFDYRRSENQKNGRNFSVEKREVESTQFEPLRRSNTMDGSFGRSGYATDGGSSQTWLQVQQRRLREKRSQRQSPVVFDYTDGASRRSQTLSPVRNYNTLSAAKEPKFVTIKRTTEQVVNKPFKNDSIDSSPFDYQSRTASMNRSYNSPRRNMPITSSPFEDMTRNESVSSYRSETETEVSRPETPAFPVTPRTPIHFGSASYLPPKSPTLQRRDLSNRIHEVANVNETVSTYTSRRNSNNSAIFNANSEPFEIAAHHVKFARDSSKFWYKPTLTREEAIALLRNAQPGTFLVRDSTTFANAFGLVVRVAQPPPGSKGGVDELVRHFLVEPTVRGVRLKGCSNEPVFSSLSALIYQHSVTPLALPCRLSLPERDIQQRDFSSPAQMQLVSQGAACNVLYLFSVDTESLTGPQALRKAICLLFERRPLPTPTEVHFKVAQQGVTLTDNSRQLFFRKHYPANSITYFGLDPDDHRWSVHIKDSDVPVKNQHIFAFVARKTSSNDNQCHIFCELEQRQPASAIVSFAQKVLLDESTRQQHAPAQI